MVLFGAAWGSDYKRSKANGGQHKNNKEKAILIEDAGRGNLYLGSYAFENQEFIRLSDDRVVNIDEILYDIWTCVFHCVEYDLHIINLLQLFQISYGLFLKI